jgi:hypothetical protein
VAEDGYHALATQLRDAPPESLAKLDEAQLTDLAGAVRDARRRQAVELAAAGDQAFGHIPWLLRGPIRKLLG